MLQKYDNEMTIQGMRLPVAGLGTVKFGRNEGVKYPNHFELPDDKQLSNLLALAHELGIRLLDTAPAYGTSEARLGKLLPNHHDWLISTKVGETFQQGQSQFDFSANAIQASIQHSLKRLQRQHLDVVLIHSDGNDEYILRQTDAVKTLQQLKQAGTIRAIGFSGKTASGGIAALQEYNMDIAMVTHNPTYQAEKAVIDTATELQKAIFIKKAFASGHLQQLGNDPIRQTMTCIFANSHANLSVILGTINPAHLQQNAATIVTVLANHQQPPND